MGSVNAEGTSCWTTGRLMLSADGGGSDVIQAVSLSAVQIDPPLENRYLVVAVTLIAAAVIKKMRVILDENLTTVSVVVRKRVALER